jgi:hypothetical protein
MRHKALGTTEMEPGLKRDLPAIFIWNVTFRAVSDHSGHQWSPCFGD